MRLITFIVAIIAASAPASAQGWREYEYPNEGFTAAFPAEPKVETTSRGELVFQQACRMDLEGIVSKRLSKPYQSGRSGHWLKIKNPSPAMVRHREGNW